MCNEHRRTVELGRISDAFAQLRIPLRFPEGAPNLAALESIRITDRAAMVRARSGDDEMELVQRRWSWPGPTGKPVFNYRGEGREFRNGASGGRCLIVADGFYEYTEPDGGSGKGRKKDRWLFTKTSEDFFCIAGIWRTDAKVGEACTMLTVEPGPDVAPYHRRQIAVLERSAWRRWLNAEAAAADLLKPSAAGTFEVRAA